MNHTLQIIKGIHPGFILARELKKRKLQKGKFANSLEEFPQTLGAITKGKRSMNLPLALKIEHALGFEEGYLMMLQLYHDIENEKRKIQKTHPDLKKIRSVLFWDTRMENIDWDKQKNAVIRRVFERGNASEKKEIRKFYGKELVEKILSNRGR